MDRRKFLSGGAYAALGAMAWSDMQLPAWASAVGRAPHALALPTADQIAWQNLEFGMFVHFAPNTWQNSEYDKLTTPLSEIDPKELNTDQWAETAVSLGAKYVVFTAKHAGGFCMWQTDTTNYSIKNTPWKHGHGDVVADISASCRKYGLKFGVYVSPRDDHFGAATGGICKTPELQAKYNKIYREQLREVFSRYGPLVEIWFDGSTVTPVGDLLRKYQPHAMIFQGPEATIRWVGNENGFAPYPCWDTLSRADARTGTSTALDGTPDGSVWMPVECDVSIRRPDWFWSTTNAKNVLTPDQLLSIYYRSIGRGAHLLLNIPANRHGLLSDPDVRSARTFGNDIRRRFGKPLAETSGRGATVTLALHKPTRVDTVILQEKIADGERVREYRLEGRVNGAWQSLGTGSAIGHKRIQPVTPVTVDALRLVVTKSAATPVIRTLAVYDTGVAPPADWNATQHLWAPDLVGDWKSHRFSLDLTDKIKVAALYRLRFVGTGGAVTGIKNVTLKLHGVADPALVKPVPGKPDELILDITGLASPITVTGYVEGAPNGEILLQKI